MQGIAEKINVARSLQVLNFYSFDDIQQVLADYIIKILECLYLYWKIFIL